FRIDDNADKSDTVVEAAGRDSAKPASGGQFFIQTTRQVAKHRLRSPESDPPCESRCAHRASFSAKDTMGGTNARPKTSDPTSMRDGTATKETDHRSDGTSDVIASPNIIRAI